MYPYGNPSLSMDTCWQSGDMKPNDVVRVIRDNYTPVNKNAMRNSVGQEISYVQNFVNSKFLGREELPVNSGYITNLSGKYIVGDSGFYQSGLMIGPHETWSHDFFSESHTSAFVMSGNAFIHVSGSDGGIGIYGNGYNDDIIESLGGGFYITANGLAGIYMDPNPQLVTISDKAKVVGHFGCNNVTPTGMAAVQTGVPASTDATIITEILNVIKNYGMMAKV